MRGKEADAWQMLARSDVGSSSNAPVNRGDGGEATLSGGGFKRTGRVPSIIAAKGSEGPVIVLVTL